MNRQPQRACRHCPRAVQSTAGHYLMLREQTCCRGHGLTRTSPSSIAAGMTATTMTMACVEGANLGCPRTLGGSFRHVRVEFTMLTCTQPASSFCSLWTIICRRCLRAGRSVRQCAADQPGRPGTRRAAEQTGPAQGVNPLALYEHVGLQSKAAQHHKLTCGMHCSSHVKWVVALWPEGMHGPD